MLHEQTQEFPDHLENGREGDCYRAAIACLLKIHIEQVPHFVEMHPDPESAEYFYESVRYVEEHVPGWTLKTVQVNFPIYTDLDNCPDRVIVGGVSPRGDWYHAVIADSITGNVLWDPHPSRAGVGEHRYVLALTEKQ